MEKFDFTKFEDQKRFEELPSEKKEELIAESHDEAKKEERERMIEIVKKLDWSKRMSANSWEIDSIIEEYNKGVSDENLKWRLPTKDELVAAIEANVIDNHGEGMFDNRTRWSWSGTKVIEKRWDSEKGEFVDKENVFVVKANGEVDTAILYHYGLRLARKKNSK